MLKEPSQKLSPKDIDFYHDDKSHRWNTTKLWFAAGCLSICALIFVLSGVGYFLLASQIENCGSYSELTLQVGKEIFDKCTTIIPPICLLILTFYFSQNKKDSS